MSLAGGGWEGRGGMATMSWTAMVPDGAVTSVASRCRDGGCAAAGVIRGGAELGLCRCKVSGAAWRNGLSVLCCWFALSAASTRSVSACCGLRRSAGTLGKSRVSCRAGRCLGSDTSCSIGAPAFPGFQAPGVRMGLTRLAGTWPRWMLWPALPYHPTTCVGAGLAVQGP